MNCLSIHYHTQYISKKIWLETKKTAPLKHYNYYDWHKKEQGTANKTPTQYPATMPVLEYQSSEANSSLET